MKQPDTGGADGAPSVTRTTAFAWYTVGLLSLAYVVSIMDRYLLSVVLEDLKQELTLTDTQLGILQGPSFVVIYALASLPLGRWADVGNRKWIIVGSLMLWSVATVACAFAESYVQLMVARSVVGLGEAALVPAAMSLIVAMFSPDRLSRGISIFTMGASFGRAVGLSGGGAFLVLASGGGALSELLERGAFSPWQGIFLAGGLVGFGLATIFALTLREPRRVLAAKSSLDFMPAFRHFFRHFTGYMAVVVPFSMASAITNMMGAWGVSFYIRKHELSPALAGELMGLTVLACAPFGHLTGGWLNDWLRSRGVRGAQPLVLILGLMSGPFIIGFASAATVPVAAFLFGLSYATISVSAPTSYSGVQALTPDAHRGVMFGLLVTVSTLVGGGLGPVLVGVAGDSFFPNATHLGPAIILSTVVFAGCGLLTAWRFRPAFIRSVEAARPSDVP